MNQGRNTGRSSGISITQPVNLFIYGAWYHHGFKWWIFRLYTSVNFLVVYSFWDQL